MRPIPCVGLCGLLCAALTGSGQEYGTTAGKSYISLDLGLALQSDIGVKEIGGTSQSGVDLKFDPGVRVDVAGGYHITERFGAELSVGYVFNSVDEVSGGPAGFNVDDLMQVPVMINLVYRVAADIPIEPFLGGGVGGVLSVLSLNSTTQEDFAFGYQGFVGAKYRISEQTEVTVVYKFLGTTDLEFEDFETDGSLTHAFAVGLRYSF
jgi:opacity protein-like surface antigen